MLHLQPNCAAAPKMHIYLQIDLGCAHPAQLHGPASRHSLCPPMALGPKSLHPYLSEKSRNSKQVAGKSHNKQFVRTEQNSSKSSQFLQTSTACFGLASFNGIVHWHCMLVSSSQSMRLQGNMFRLLPLIVPQQPWLCPQTCEETECRVGCGRSAASRSPFSQ